ncbi:RBBP9/YdeN family alpha/beta hydrolase [Caviibacterium pharyngocola]|uniref:Serine hydrolase family protein n=1 Tax=Caviibacterium pharyngocola TaxID=28159 RepID=A0A2M8RYM7_9PAST|nr:alpha/beta fold hydrolase [Caviibacterium pharyngocola]PJG83985.1 serine hydrolase family protein [Caviibacterium pharyngocola]
MKQVYIVHGYTASPNSHWFPYLSRELQRRHIRCDSLAMPNSAQPNEREWRAYLSAHTELSEETLFVAHSLGCIATLNFLADRYSTHNLPPILGGIFVSGFYQPLDNLPELTPFATAFAQLPHDHFAQIFRRTPTVIAACDDPVVAHSHSDQLARLLNAEYIRLPQGGHFLDRQGWYEFPLVLAKLCALFEEK